MGAGIMLDFITLIRTTVQIGISRLQAKLFQELI